MGEQVIFGDIAKAIGQMGDRRFRRVLFLGVGLTIALLVAAYSAFLWMMFSLDPGSWNLPFLGPNATLGGLFTWGSFALLLVLSIFLMIPVASAITSMFLDDVADAVEARHYPNLMPAPRIPFGEAARDTFSFLALLVFVNLIALVLLPFYWFVAPLVFYGINGYMLGREYFTVAAMRRLGREGARDLRRKHRTEIWAAGILMAIPLSIPVMNLLIPILGAATFTHIFHRIASR